MINSKLQIIRLGVAVAVAMATTSCIGDGSSDDKDDVKLLQQNASTTYDGMYGKLIESLAPEDPAEAGIPPLLGLDYPLEGMEDFTPPTGLEENQPTVTSLDFDPSQVPTAVPEPGLLVSLAAAYLASKRIRRSRIRTQST